MYGLKAYESTRCDECGQALIYHHIYDGENSLIAPPNVYGPFTDYCITCVDSFEAQAKAV